MPDESLADKIRDKLLTGDLPREDPIKTWAGYGSQRPCAACDAPIWPAQVEYEIDRPNGERLAMHVGCHGLWIAERIRRGWAPALHSPGTLPNGTSSAS